MCLSWCRGSIQVTSNAWWNRSRGQTPPRSDTLPRSDTPGSDTPQVRHPPGSDTPHSPLRSMCGRYASYWNAFLFYLHWKLKSPGERCHQSFILLLQRIKICKSEKKLLLLLFSFHFLSHLRIVRHSAGSSAGRHATIPATTWHKLSLEYKL